jgi:hypothetical protein
LKKHIHLLEGYRTPHLAIDSKRKRNKAEILTT